MPSSVNDLYWKTEHQKQDCERFIAFTHEHPSVKFYWPNKSSAPWHLQCKVIDDGGYETIVDFWPHKGKAYTNKVRRSTTFEDALTSAYMEEEQVDVIED